MMRSVDEDEEGRNGGAAVSNGVTNPAFESDGVDGPDSAAAATNGRPRVNPFSLQDGDDFATATRSDRQRIREGCSCLGLVPLPCFKCCLKAPWLLCFLCWASTIQVRSPYL